MFNPKRLKLARKRRAVSKIDLAELVNLSVQTISDWENGNTIPKEENLKELSNALNFPSDFFKGIELPELELNKVSFRALTKMKASIRDSVIASGEIAIYLNSWIESKFNLPSNNLLSLIGDSPEDTANNVRKKWNIKTTKLGNTIHLLEKHGVRVYSLVEKSNDIDAFSVWSSNIPFVFLNTFKSPERSRFDAMHELGHLILHRTGIPRDKRVEREANAFASAILMPKDDIMNLKNIHLDLYKLIELKRKWDVSLSALIYRLYSLGIITEWQNRSFIIESKKYGYDRNEPNSINRETPLIFDKVFSQLKIDGVDLNSVAYDLSLPPIEIHKLIFNLFQSYDGGGQMCINSNKPDLRRIK